MYYDDLFKLVPNTRKGKARLKNQIQFNNTLAQLVNLWLNQYKWEGLPETFDPRFFELNMLLRGVCGAFNVMDSTIALTLSPSGGVNINGKWLKAFGTGCNGFNEEFTLYIEGDEKETVVQNSIGFKYKKPDAVLARDNALMYPAINYLIRYAEQISDIDRSIEVIAKTSKSPVMLTGFEQQVGEIKKMIESYEDNEDFILALKNPANSMQAFNVGQDPSKMKDLWEIRENLWNNAMEFMGYKNNPQADKKERLLTGEIEANNELTHVSGDSGLEWRKKFIEDCKAAGFTEFNGVTVERNEVESETTELDIEGGLDDEEKVEVKEDD